MCQSGVQAGGGVTLAQHKAIPILPLGVGRIHIQLLKVQVGKQIRGGQASAGVTRLGAVGSGEDAHTHLAGGDLQLLLIHAILLNLSCPPTRQNASSNITEAHRPPYSIPSYTGVCQRSFPEKTGKGCAFAHPCILVYFFHRPLGYRPSAVFSFSICTTTGLSAA